MNSQYFNKDCFEVLPTIADNSVDLIFCDLPYQVTNCKWDCALDLDKLWIEFKRIRKDTTPIVMTCTTKFGLELIKANPKEFRFDMVWQKSRKCGFLQARKKPLCNHEMVYFFYKKQPKYNYLKYHKYSKKESSKKALTGVSYDPPLPASVIVNDEKQLYSSKSGTCGNIKHRIEGSYDPGLPGSILKIASKKPSKHQTGKPLDLMEFILKYWSCEGDTIFDPTFGGGSMAIQSKIMNRKFIGCELDKKFYDDTIVLLEKYEISTDL
jgi:site-specific DNA-methyltransferase (adenine-specific)